MFICLVMHNWRRWQSALTLPRILYVGHILRGHKSSSKNCKTTHSVNLYFITLVHGANQAHSLPNEIEVDSCAFLLWTNNNNPVTIANRSAYDCLIGLCLSISGLNYYQQMPRRRRRPLRFPWLHIWFRLDGYF